MIYEISYVAKLKESTMHGYYGEVEKLPEVGESIDIEIDEVSTKFTILNIVHMSGNSNVLTMYLI